MLTLSLSAPKPRKKKKKERILTGEDRVRQRREMGDIFGFGWLVGQWIVVVINFQKTFGLCGMQGFTVDKGWDVMLEDNRRTDGWTNVKIELETLETEFAI